MSYLSQIAQNNSIAIGLMNDEILNLLGRDVNSSRGCAVRCENSAQILCDADAGSHEKEFIIAHELAHLLFGHMREGKQGVSSQHAEMEADMFAAALMALILFEEVKQK